jgi:hypothetical protein
MDEETGATEEIVFRITGEQVRRLREWKRAVDERAFKQALETGLSPRGAPLDKDTLAMMRLAAEQGAIVPVYGAIQGAYVYSFVPTTLGLVVKVENTETGDSIDLTNYDNW